jgi:D-alanyl-D-alanine carboxypeptidase (penicillin-binding protein 5/6)
VSDALPVARSHLTRTALAAVLAALLLAPTAGAQERRAPHVDAAAAVVVDAQDGHVLYGRSRTQRRSIASVTKLMTVLVALDELPLARKVRAVPYSPMPAESRIDLRPGERMSVADLLRAVLLESANDAAETLAVRASGSLGAFVDAMNAKARDLRLTHTHFANPVGLDQAGNHSTATDLARLARRVLANDFLAATVDMPKARLSTGARTRIVTNRNRLIARVPSMNGVKTGHTQQAGYVLVGSARRKGADLVSVVMGEPSEAARDADTLALLDHGFGFYRRLPVVRRGATLARPQVEYFGDREAPLVAARRAAVTVRRGERVRTVVAAPGQVSGPLPAGARVGRVRVLVEGRVVRTVPLVTAGSVPEAGLLRKASRLAIPLLLVAAGVTLWVIARRRRGHQVDVRRPARAD